MDDFQNRRGLSISTLHVVMCLLIVLGCRARAMPEESSRAARIRLEVEGTLDRLESGTGHGVAIRQLVPRINVELERETNGLGIHFETCSQLRDGLIELSELRGAERTNKIRELRMLVEQLPQIEF